MPRSPMSSRHGWSGKAWSSDRVSTVTSVPVSKKGREGAMRRLGIVLALGLAAGAAWAQGKEPIALRDMGSFHVGGGVIGIAGQPVKEIVFQPRRGPPKHAPERKVSSEADLRARLPAAKPQRQAAFADVARRRAHRRDLRDHAGWPRRLAYLFHPQGLGHLHLRCRGARPRRLDRYLQGRRAV